jgi:hypothetical protein
MRPEVSDDSARFGLWPTLVGLAAGAALIWMMFALATGMR